MNTPIIDFLRNVNDENLVAAKQNIHAAIYAKVSEALTAREAQMRDSLYTTQKEN